MNEQHEGTDSVPWDTGSPGSAEIVLWQRAQAGDPDAFARIFDQHQGRVYRQALRVVPSSHDAEDVMAMVFLEAWRKRSSVRVVEGSILAWLLLTTTYVASNAARAKRRYRIAMAKLPQQEREDDPSDMVLERLDSAALSSRVRTAFDRLTAADRNILTLCVLNEFSTAQASEALGIPVGTVKSRLSRAKRRLAALTGPAPLTEALPTVGGEAK